MSKSEPPPKRTQKLDILLAGDPAGDKVSVISSTMFYHAMIEKMDVS
jgi:hypothetical protein